MARRTSTLDQVHVALLLIAVVGSALVFAPRGGVDGITVGKATVVALAAVGVAAAGLVSAVQDARLRVPRPPAVLAAAAFVALLLVRVVVSDDIARGVVGAFGRYAGFGIYLAALALFLAAAARPDHRTLVRFARGMTVGAIVVALFALDEAFLGLGPQWAARPGVASTLGNANFLSSWAAAVTPLAVVLAVDRRQPTGWRAAAAVAAVGLVVSVVLAGSFQGFFVLAAVAVTLGLAWAAGRLRRGALYGLFGATAVGGLAAAALTLAGATGRGPLRFFGESIGVQLRAEYWAAALRMAAEQPLLGVGPGRFAEAYRVARTPEAAQLVALESAPDAAHNTLLHLLAEGGAALALGWLVFAALVTWAMLAELARREGADRLWYAGIGAVWVGYLLQAIISIDTPLMIALGWVAAGLVVAPQVRSSWVRGLPWTPHVRGRARRRSTSVLERVAVACGVALLLVATWVVTLPYRADAASARDGEVVVLDRDGQELRAQRLANAPADAVLQTRSMALAPWESRYLTAVLEAAVAEGQGELALSTVETRLADRPVEFALTLNAARLAAVVEDEDLARTRFEQTLELEPHHPDLVVEVRTFAEGIGDEAWVAALSAQLERLDPDHELVSGAGEDG